MRLSAATTISQANQRRAISRERAKFASPISSATLPGINISTSSSVGDDVSAESARLRQRRNGVAARRTSGRTARRRQRRLQFLARAGVRSQPRRRDLRFGRARLVRQRYDRRRDQLRHDQPDREAAILVPAASRRLRHLVDRHHARPARSENSVTPSRAAGSANTATSLPAPIAQSARPNNVSPRFGDARTARAPARNRRCRIRT